MPRVQGEVTFPEQRLPGKAGKMPGLETQHYSVGRTTPHGAPWATRLEAQALEDYGNKM